MPLRVKPVIWHVPMKSNRALAPVLMERMLPPKAVARVKARTPAWMLVEPV